MENREIPTAAQLYYQEDKSPDELMIEFARIHVQRALEAAAEKAEVDNSFPHLQDWCVNKQSILNAYPLDKIK